MKHDLIARYVYAVVRHLPHKTRADVEKELESLISDMLDARCGDILPADKDVRVVLTELGTPDELAAKYSGGDRKALISGVYYLAYVRMLKLVLPIAAAAVALGTLISVLSGPTGENLILYALRLFGQPIGGMIAGVVQAFAVITIIFAVLERTKTDLSGDHLSYLPMVPRQSQRIKPYEPIFGILISIAVAVLFLGFPQAAGFRHDGAWLSVFDIAVIRSFWPFIILWTVLSISVESVRLIEGRYTKRLAAVTVAANLLIMGSTAVVFLNRRIASHAFIDYLSDLFAGEASDFVFHIAANFNAVLVAAVCVALIIESVTAVYRAYRHL